MDYYDYMREMKREMRMRGKREYMRYKRETQYNHTVIALCAVVIVFYLIV